MVTIFPWINWILNLSIMKAILPSDEDLFGIGKIQGYACYLPTLQTSWTDWFPALRRKLWLSDLVRTRKLSETCSALLSRMDSIKKMPTQRSSFRCKIALPLPIQKHLLTIPELLARTQQPLPSGRHYCILSCTHASWRSSGLSFQLPIFHHQSKTQKLETWRTSKQSSKKALESSRLSPDSCLKRHHLRATRSTANSFLAAPRSAGGFSASVVIKLSGDRIQTSFDQRGGWKHRPRNLRRWTRRWIWCLDMGGINVSGRTSRSWNWIRFSLRWVSRASFVRDFTDGRTNSYFDGLISMLSIH